jgi:hypothetical protein
LWLAATAATSGALSPGHPESVGGLPKRTARSDREHKLAAARQFEPRVTVNPHLVLLLAERRRRRTASKEDRMNLSRSQPV